MPGVDRGAVGCRLLLVGGVADQVVKKAVRGCRAEVDFVNRIADAVAWIGGAVGVAGVGGGGHPDAKEAYGDWFGSEVNGIGAAFTGGDDALRECLPDTARG